MALVIEEQSKAQALRPPKRVARSISGSAMIVKYVLPVVALGLLVFAVYYVTNTQAAPSSVEPPVQPAKAPFDNTVAAAGMIEPKSEDINIGSPVPGLVVEVFVVEEDRVQKGQPLFRLDDRQLQAELIVRKAALKSAQTQLLQHEQEPRKERIPVAKAQVTEAEANLADQRDQLERTQELYKRGGVATEQDLIARRTAYRAAEAKLAYAKAEFDLLMAGAWQYEKEAAQAAVAQAEAQIQATEIELERLTITAREEGVVLQVNVRPGEFVGAPASETLIILGSVDQLHVRVDIDEHDIPRFVPGSSARATIRGNPNESFPLKFVRVEPYVVPKRSLTGANTERVDTRVLQVIYSLDPAGKSVYVGQQLEVFIEADKASDAAVSQSGTADSRS